VIRKESVRKYGVGLFNALNSAGASLGSIFNNFQVPRITYATGGLVQNKPELPDMGTVQLQIGAQGFPVMGRQDVIQELKVAIQREGLMRRNA